MNRIHPNPKILLLPGYADSGPAHWQSLWQAKNSNIHRVVQDDWNSPACSEWCKRLEQAIAQGGDDIALVAHSLGCLLVAHWAARTRHRVKGALLVAVPDPDGKAFPPLATGFAPLPRAPLPFLNIVVASTDDPYSTIEFSRAIAHDWGSELVNVGAAGHINADSGLGDWPFGIALLNRLLGP